MIDPITGPFDYKLDPPSESYAYPCRDCMAQGCVKCNWIGYRPLTAEEIRQERLENRNQERS